MPEAANRWSSGLLEQRLTPEGVELLRSEIVSTGLFEHDQPAGRMSSPHNVIQVRIDDRLVRVQRRTFLSGCASGSRIRRRGCRQARGRTVGSGRTCPPGTRSGTGPAPNARTLPHLVSATRNGRGLLRAKDAVPRQGDIGYPGFPPHPVTRYHSVLTTEEARAVTQALDDAGLGAGWRTASRSQARASIQLLPRRGQSETWSSSCSSPTSRTASRSAWRADERLRIDRLQAHGPGRSGIHFRNESRGFDNEHREEYVGTAS